MDPDAAFDEVDPFAGLEARLADSFDDELSEFDYARTDEQAQAEIEATMDRLRRRAAQPGAAPSQGAAGDGSVAGGDASSEAAQVVSSTPTARSAGSGAGLRIVDEELDLDVSYSDVVAPTPQQPAAPATPIPGSSASTSLVLNDDHDAAADAALFQGDLTADGESSFVDELLRDDEPGDAAEVALDEDLLPGDAVGATGSVAAPLADLLPDDLATDDEPLFLASSDDDDVSTPTFGALIDDAPSEQPVAEAPAPRARAPRTASTPEAAEAFEIPANKAIPGASVIPGTAENPPLTKPTPVVDATERGSSKRESDGRVARLKDDAASIPGVRIPDTRLATAEQMEAADRQPLPRLKSPAVAVDDDELDADIATADLDGELPDSIDHLIPDRERPPLLVYLLLTALTLAALGALLWYTNRDTGEPTSVEGTAPAADVASDAGAGDVPAEQPTTGVDAVASQPDVVTPPAGVRMDEAIPLIAKAVDRCDTNGLLGTLRSSAEVAVQVDLRIDFLDDAGAVYYTAERATGAINPGQAVSFTFVLFGEPLEAQYVGVAPADCRFEITGVFAA